MAGLARTIHALDIFVTAFPLAGGRGGKMETQRFN
jgi:hypothetical protein